MRLAKDGAVLPESAYTRSATLAGKPLTGLVDARKALALFDDGATLVFQGLHRYWPPLTQLVAELELELGHPCQANAYLTPPGSQGFAVHNDTHDVFVFQTAGSKLWEVHGQDGPEDVLLEPGLSMYLPTGTPHAARAQDTVSLHVTLGINQLTWRGLLERTVAPVLADVPDEHLPAGYLDDPAAARRRARRPAGAARRRRTTGGRRRRRRDRDPPVPDLPAAAAVRRPARHARLRRPRRHDPAAPAARPPVRPARPRRPGRGAARRPVDDGAGLAPPRRSTRCAPAATFTPGDLPLDEQSRLVLCRRLVREGLLEIA